MRRIWAWFVLPSPEFRAMYAAVIDAFFVDHRDA